MPTVLKNTGIEIFVFDNQAVFPLSLTRDGLVTEDFFEIEKLDESVKYSFIENIKKLALSYQFSKRFILSFIGKYARREYYNELIPLIFSANKILPFSCDESRKQDQYTFVDFISCSQKRGVIYEHDLIDVLDSMSYSYFQNVDKQVDIIETAIYNYVLNRNYSRYNSYKNQVPTNLYLNSWLFLKNFDLNKLSENFKSLIQPVLLQTIKINDEWSVLTHSSNVDSIPKQADKLINTSNSRYFMFVIYEDKSKTTTEFATLWNKIGE